MGIVTTNIPVFLSGRRDIIEEEKNENQQQHHFIPDSIRLEIEPVAFDIHKHGHRYRRTTQCQVEHVLFLLDTSGSIGEHDFKRLTRTLGDLVPLFCKSIEIAAMTFSHEHYLEFCFNEFDNDCAGRLAARRAIRHIPYRRGNTHTAEAVQCAFDNILTPRCGLAPEDECVIIVFFTDGRSNGKGSVCKVVEQLKQQRKFESISVGIGGATNEEELRCLASDANSTNRFQFPSFDGFVENLSKIETAFSNAGFTCTNPVESNQSSDTFHATSDCNNFSDDGFSGDGSSGALPV